MVIFHASVGHANGNRQDSFSEIDKFWRCQWVAVPTTILKDFVLDGDTKFYRYAREPECQRRWILPGLRCNWGSNRAYPGMEQLFYWRFALITTLEVVPVALEGSDDPCSKSNSSKFTDGLNVWHAVTCGFLGAFFSRPTAILETTGCLQLLSLQLCVDNSLRKWFLHALLEPSHVSFLVVSTATCIPLVCSLTFGKM